MLSLAMIFWDRILARLLRDAPFKVRSTKLLSVDFTPPNKNEAITSPLPSSSALQQHWA
jgi:hypothetical protein